MAFLAGRVETCDTGIGIFTAVVSDNQNPRSIAAVDANGGWWTTLAYPGYRVTAGAPGYNPKTVVITEEDIKRGSVIICLEEIRDTETTKQSGHGWCMFNTAMASEDPESQSDGIRSSLRRLRGAIRSTPMGAQLVDDYESEESGQALQDVIGRDPRLALDALRLVLEALPVIRSLSGHDALIERRVQVSDSLVERTLQFAERLRGADPQRLDEPMKRFSIFVENLRCGDTATIWEQLNTPPDC